MLQISCPRNITEISTLIYGHLHSTGQQNGVPRNLQILKSFIFKCDSDSLASKTSPLC